ncbi:DNA glycosylase [Russula earlei]|uniref:DNA glycosylase n=1 Tax=Russula earlei TaxID=71964 RepID=A0ACC0TVN5_9AGAM|nr:DNA glycosylase [Russula earlei]
MLDVAKERLLSISKDPLAVNVHQHLHLLTHSPGYAAFFLTSLDRYERLLNAKPVLIQGVFFLLSVRYGGLAHSQSHNYVVPESVAGDPWKLLVAVMLLNKTAGRIAVPVFWTLMTRWPTPESLAKADPLEVEECIRCLGLQYTRARRLVALSAAYLELHDKPRSNCWHDSSTPISYLPGSGPYALDSYRIYCAGTDAWRTVMPRDKELVRYLKWRWAVHGVQWSPTLGVICPASETYIEQLIHELVTLNPYRPR